MSEHSSVFDPSILHWVTATFALTIATQIISTALIAGRIYVASMPYTFTHQFHTGQSPRASSDRTAAKTMNNNHPPIPHIPIEEEERDSQRAKYLSLVLIVAESGAVYTSAALIQLITYLLNMNAGVILELVLAQLSVSLFILVQIKSEFECNAQYSIFHRR